MKNLKSLLIFLIIIISISFRFVGLGYSEFQGDEVSAQNYLFDENNNFFEFILSRGVPPAQFIITYTINFFFLEHVNIEYIMRIPFFIAGVISLFLVYYICTNILKFGFTQKITTLFLFGFAGLFVAFSRIVQYQSFVILISLLVVSTCLQYLQSPKQRYLLFFSVASGIGLLFHFDSLSFIIPTGVFLSLSIVFYSKNSLQQKIKNLAFLSVPAMLITLPFYVPFVMHPVFRSETFNYLFGHRISATKALDSVFYSVELIRYYDSRPFSILFFTLVSAGLFAFFKNNKLKRITIPILCFGVFLLAIRYLLVEPDPAIKGLSAILWSTLLMISASLHLQIKDKKILLLVVWFLFSFVTYGVYFSKPLTHIYNFLGPATFLAGYGAGEIIKFKKFVHKVAYAIIFLTVFVQGAFLYSAFIDTNPEYPWNSKKSSILKMPVDIANGEKVDGIFGFPYKRNWKDISSILKSNEVQSYSSNEKHRLAKYYLWRIKRDDQNFDAYVFIKKPQSFDTVDNSDTKQSLRIIETKDYKIYLY